MVSFKNDHPDSIMIGFAKNTEWGLDEGIENSKQGYTLWAEIDGEMKMIGCSEGLENILPYSVSDEGINVNFEGDSEDILNHPDSSSGHTLSMTGTLDVHNIDPEFERAFNELHESVQQYRMALEDCFQHIGSQLISQAVKDIEKFTESLRRMNWDSHRTHINPYSKKITRLKVKGKVGNKGRTSAQYFTLKATRKQNTSSVK